MSRPARAVADAIRSGGLADTKAPRIQAILEEIRERRGWFDLSFLRDLSDDDARGRADVSRGVGPKTAAVVLSFSLDRDAMPVDTHVHRVTTRLGWLPPRASAEKADRLLHELIPEGMRTDPHRTDPAGPRDLQGTDPAVPRLPLEGHLPDGSPYLADA